MTGQATDVAGDSTGAAPRAPGGFDRPDELSEQRKAELIRAAAHEAALSRAAAARPGADTEVELAAFLDRYFRHVAAEDILPWPAAELVDVGCGHREFAQVRVPGTQKVRVFTPSAEQLQGRVPHTVVEVVTDDMPFLVDSVTQELLRHDIALQLVIHPQFVVRRDLEGNLLDVLGTLDAHEAPREALVESWMHLEVSRQPGADAEEAVCRGLLEVLRDVREAVEDWPRMRANAQRLAAELAAAPPRGVDPEEAAETAEFLRWLADDHFTFLGYREYRLVDDGGVDALAAVPGTGLGLLRPDKPKPRALTEFPEQVRARIRDPKLLMVTKANSRSTVHRTVYLDYIGVKLFDDAGAVVGERRFLGLFTWSAYITSVVSVPLLRRKVAAVFERSGYPPQSHSGKDLLKILEDHPRDDLFQISVRELYETAIGVLHLQERRRLRLFMRRDVFGRFFSCLVYLPRERYSTNVRVRMQSILQEALHGTSVDDALRVADSVLARVYFIVRVSPNTVVEVDRDELEQRLAAATRTWDDAFAETLDARFGDNEVDPVLAKRYTGAFPEAYKEDFPAHVAVDDIEAIERLRDTGDIGLDLYEPGGASAGELRLKVYRVGPQVSLSVVLPLLQCMGVEVVEERPYGIERHDAEHAWVYDFGLRRTWPIDPADKRGRHRRFEEAFTAIWRGVAEADRFQALVLRVGLSWRQIVVLRAYAKYLRQAGSRFSQEYVEAAVAGNPAIAQMLVELFETRFAPDVTSDPEERDRLEAGIVTRIEAALDNVSSLDEDRILRSFLALVRATLRTNFWQQDAGESKPYLSLKFASQEVPDLPQPRPKFEIFVYSPRMEGVHLRFGSVARGGIRYSDRREDFRTEILGLAKTQTVKNAVIVPVGSKGGFVVKRPADPSDREAVQAEVVGCYRTLIRGMLDLTDNLQIDAAGRTVVPPPDTVRHDGDDTYLVVAADKGTATFSDIANGIAAEYHYWLGDAFASGGSAGFDHKAMGITARGAWESVRRHLRELGINSQTTDFTVVGIGDMSGDVFGNGMLLSQHIKLIAAFDHRHVFVDPDPQPASSFEERRRLFGLARSSWADYDPAAISAGGGVWPRSAKSIPVSPEMARALEIEERPLTPSELIRAILRAPVDLLWNGGIGTYVKAHDETHADVGDRANDAVRVDARDLQCRAVAEGGNLGLTQLGRLEYALAGGRINTDAIDNSAGVDTSDHEVNIKILLETATRSGHLDPQERLPLLMAMTDEVAALVLRDNYGQNLALACSQAQAPAMLHVHAAYIDQLEKAGHLSRALEHLPDAEAIAERRAAGLGLTRPELAILLAYAKITITHDLVHSDLPDDAFAQDTLDGYFPTALRERFAAAMAEHPLRREIVATQLAGETVDYSGMSFVARLAAETTAATADIVRAHIAARRVFGIDDVWRRIEALDDVVPSEVQIDLLLGVRQNLERATRWVLASRRPPLDVAEIVTQCAAAAEVLDNLDTLLRGEEAMALEVTVAQALDDGVPADVARVTASLEHSLSALAIVDTAHHSKVDVMEVADVHFAAAELFGFSRLRALISSLSRDSRWHQMARTAARDDLLAVHAELTADVLLSTSSGVPAEERIEAWRAENGPAVSRAAAVVDDVLAGDSADLAAISVALREIRGLARTVAAPRR